MTHMPTLPDLNVGTAARCGCVTVLPVFAATALPRADYALGTDAVAAGKLEICELPRGATVAHLQARNRGPRRVLLVEGDHLIGARQNRMVTSSVLIGGKREVVAVDLTGCHATSCGLVLAIADLRENAHTRASDPGLGPSLICRPPYHDDRRCHPHDRSTTHHPAWESISVGDPARVAALRVDAARNDCRMTLWRQPVKTSAARY